MWKDTDLSWAAGFWDGEGCTSIVHQKKDGYTVPRIQMTITQKDHRVLDKWFSIFPCFTISVRQHGKQLGIMDLTTGSFENIQMIICAMWPWLSEAKKEQYLRCAKEYLKYQGTLNPARSYKYRGVKYNIFPKV